MKRRRLAALAWLPVCVGPALVQPAGAQSWQLTTGAQLRAERNDNPALAPQGSEALNTVTASASAGLARSTESAESRATGELILAPPDRAGTAEATALGRLALNHRAVLPRDSWFTRLELARDRPLDAGARVTASDVAVGRTERRVGEIAGGWTHRIDERLSLDAEASRRDTAFAQPVQGADYALATLRAGLRWDWTESRTLTLDATRSRQRLPSLSQRSTVDSLRLGLQQTWSETASGSVSVSSARSEQSFLLARQACPLPVSFCNSGLVPLQVVVEPAEQVGRDTQFGAATQWRWSERTAVSGRVSRALTPDALGLSREDLLALAVTHTWSERTTAQLALDGSRARRAGPSGAGGTSTLQTLSFSAQHRWTEQLSLSAQVQQRRFQRASDGRWASAHVLSITLQHGDERVLGSRSAD